MEPCDATIFVIEEGATPWPCLAALAHSLGCRYETFDSAERFLVTMDLQRSGCLVANLHLADDPLLALQERLATRGSLLPLIFLGAPAELSLVVRAMKDGAFTVLETSCGEEALRDSLQQALDQNRRACLRRVRSDELRHRVARLDPRERHVWHLVVGDQPNKSIARALGVSQRTVDRIRATVFAKLGVQSAVQATRLAMELGQPPWANGAPEGSWGASPAPPHAARQFQLQ